MKPYRELERCWGALWIAICYERQIPPEVAFELYDYGRIKEQSGDEIAKEIIELRKKGMPLTEISDIMGMTVDAIFKRIKREDPSLVNKFGRLEHLDKDEIIRMRNEGMTYSEIGDKYEVSRGTIFNRLKKWRHEDETT